MQVPVARPRYPDWKAPPGDGKLVIWPQPAQLLDETRANQRRLSSIQSRVSSVPLNEIRRRARAQLGHPDDARPILATGHQTELYHPGVWAKNALLHAAAAQLGGAAPVHLAVDTDAPKHLTLRWPGGTPLLITDDADAAAAPWSGLLKSPSPTHLARLSSAADSASRHWSFQSLLLQFLAALSKLSKQSQPLSNSITRAIDQIDRSLGLHTQMTIVSPVWSSEAYLLFAHHLISRADAFAAAYNASLNDFRAAHGMRTATRPMPDLFASADAIEAPFWLDDLSSGGKRSRPSVFRAGDGTAWVLQLLNGEEFVFDPRVDGWEAASRLSRWLGSTSHRLSPRALTLTTFFRLLVADQFVHGIGGGRYDQVTDRLIERYFDIEPPKFSVTTATLYFPDAIDHERVCVPCVVHEGHRLWHAALGPRKMQFVREIEAMPRRSPQRAAAFVTMQDELATAAKSDTAVQEWRARLDETKVQARHEQALFDRELFFAIQPQARLEGLIARYSEAFSSSRS